MPKHVTKNDRLLNGSPNQTLMQTQRKLTKSRLADLGATRSERQLRADCVEKLLLDREVNR